MAIGHIAAAGCTYLQLDDVSFAYLCDPKVRDGLRAAGDDPAALPRTYAEAINHALAGRPGGPDGDHAHLPGQLPEHVARVGRLRGRGGGGDVLDRRRRATSWNGTASAPAASSRCASCPRDKTVVLGLVTTKSGALESKDTLARRIDEATRYVPLDRLCLSPQCGFASTHHGNTLTEDEQWRKLERVVEVSQLVWGKT